MLKDERILCQNLVEWLYNLDLKHREVAERGSLPRSDMKGSFVCKR